MWIEYIGFNMVNNTRILITGAGPVGLLLALIMKHQGFEPVIVDKISSKRTAFSKALSIAPSTLKLFHGLGISDKFLSQGNRLDKALICEDYYTRKVLLAKKCWLKRYW
jgi:2-polyprenyl-6-methoxyphenol hydroxylase-like FAD-dependent oxidoreductase